MHGGSQGSINVVSTDMSPAFIKGVKENFPGADITFDKSHIIKVLNTAVDEARRQEKENIPS